MNKNFQQFLDNNPKYIGFIIKTFNLRQRLPFSSEEELTAMATTCLWHSHSLYLKNNKKYKIGSYFKFVIARLIKTDYKELFFRGCEQESVNNIIDDSILETTDFINSMLLILSNQERAVLELRFFKSKTLKECGKTLNKSHEWVRRKEKQALDKIKEHWYARNS